MNIPHPFMRRVISLSILFLALPTALPHSGGNSARAASASKIQQPASAQALRVIPMRVRENHIYVDVQVNGSMPLGFVLDTGATNPFLNERRARELGILHKDLHPHQGIGTGEGATPLASAKHVTLNLSDIELKDQTIYITPAEKLEAVVGHSIDGIIGAEVFNRYVVEIDYLAQTVSLFDPRAYQYAGRGEIIPLKLSGDRPFVKMKIEIADHAAMDGLFVIDTGSSSGLSLHTQFVNKHQILALARPVTPHITYGLAGESKEWLGRVQNIQLGKYLIKQPITAFAQAAKGSAADSSYDGAIGGEILRRFKVIFDYAHKQMILERNTEYDEPFEADMSGLLLLAEGNDFKTLRIVRVLEHSPAAEAGLREGAVLTTINGHSTADFTLEQIKEMFKREGQEMVLGTQRGEPVPPVKIKLRRLI